MIQPYYQNEFGVLYHGDCLEIIPQLGVKADMVLCDPPYGTTACKWDSVIPLDKMWPAISEVILKGSNVVITGIQPFTSVLIASNIKQFKYRFVWDKIRKTGHLNAKKRPMRKTEDVCVFCDGVGKYNPQMAKGVLHQRGPFGKRSEKTTVYGAFSDENRTYHSDEYYPDDILRFLAEMQSEHPTQKPVALMEYLIKTYTNEGETVLDFAAGSGTTGVAAINTFRKYILIEKEEKYCEIAAKRLSAYRN